MSNDSRTGESIAGSDGKADSLAAEAKRLAARRRFLLGGAAALPLIVTLGQREAWAASAALCQSMGLQYDKTYADQVLQQKLAAGQNPGGVSVSAFCDPANRWN